MFNKSINDVENAYNIIKYIMKGNNPKVKEKLCREFWGNQMKKLSYCTLSI